MIKKSIYIETSIISYLAARRSRNLIAAAWQEITFEFWETRRHRYHLYTSEIVVIEASAGDPALAERRLNLLAGIPGLLINTETKSLAANIIKKGALPTNAQIDALHIAVATIHGMDYLLTWNCRHIDNPEAKPKVRAICQKLGYNCPEICTPMQIMES